MKTNKSKPIFITREYPLIFLYLAAISLSLMYVISRSRIVVCTIVMTVLSIGVFMLFYVLRKHKGFAALAAMALGFVCMTLLYMGQYTRGGNSIMDYIFTASSFFDPFFAGVSIVVFSVIVGFACCYFSVYSPRPCFLMLPSFIPLILSVRTAGGIPGGMLIFMLTGFAASVAVMAHPEFPADNIYIIDKRSVRERIMAVLAAGAVLAGLLAVLPRSDKTPQGEYLDNVFSETGGYYAASERLTNFLMSSSVNTGANSPRGNLLFIAGADSPMTLVRWAFDEYYGSGGWRTSREFDTGYADWQTTAARRSSAELIYRLKNAAEAGMLEEYSELLKSVSYSTNAIDGRSVTGEMSPVSAQVGIAIRDGSQTSVIIHPNDTFGLRVAGYSGRSFRTMRDEIFTESNLQTNAAYTLDYFFDLPNEEFIRAMEKTDFGQLLADAAEENVITNSTANAFLDEMEFAKRYREVTYSKGMTENIEELAEDITAGLDSDYDKALAIERWFGESGFVYDMDFVPAVVDAEYFIFDSKTGICSDFATAATLIARAAGLTARYTEGFNLSEDVLEEDGLFYVTDAQAHAVASIYMDGFGWMMIDPTRYVPVISDDEGGVVLLPYIIAAGIVIVLIMIFRRPLSELLFTVTFPLRSKHSRVREIYLRTRALAAGISGVNPESTAVGEVCDIITRTLSMPEQASRICGAADELFYGDGEADAGGLLRCYKQIRRMKRRMRK